MAQLAQATRKASDGWVLALLCLSQFIVVLDFSIVNVALPGMQRDLHFSPNALQWVISAYALALGGFLLLAGRASDLFGRRRLFFIGLAWFVGASLLGGLAPTGAWLIAARALQGLGAAILSPTALSLTTTTFAEGPARNRALGAMGSVASSGFAAGAILGGVLTATAGWRWVMFVNVPIGLLALVAIPLLLPRDSIAVGSKRLDIAGAVSSTLGLVTLVYAIANGNAAGWRSPLTLGLFAVAVALLVGFVVIERRTAEPLVPFDIFRSRSLVGANLVAMLAPGAFGALIFVLTLFFQDVQHISPLLTGVVFLPLAVILFFGTNIISRQVQRFGYTVLLSGGLVVLALGLLFLALPFSPHVTYLGQIFPALIVVGVGISAVFGTMIIAATGGVPNEQQGLATGLLSTSQQVGSSIGLAIIAAVIASRVGHDQGSASFADGLRAALFVCMSFALLGAIVAATVIRATPAQSVPAKQM